MSDVISKNPFVVKNTLVDEKINHRITTDIFFSSCYLSIRGEY